MKIRISNHKLMIETGRYNQTSRNERFWLICNSGIIEDEFLFLFNCPKYSIPRKKFYDQIQQNFVDFRACLHGVGDPGLVGLVLLFSRSGGHKTKETYPTRPGSPTPCKQGLNQLSYTELIIKLMNSQNFSVNSHLLKFVSLCNDLRTNLSSNHAEDT